MRIFYAVLILLLTSIGLKAQESIYLPFFSTEGCSPQIGISSTYIFSDYIYKYGKYNPIVAEKRDSITSVESTELARESAELLSTKFFILGRIVKLETHYHVSVSIHAAESGLTVWRKSAETDDVNDLPALLDLFASKLATNSKWSQHGDVFLVYKGETKKAEKIKSNVGLGLSTGWFYQTYDQYNTQIVPGFGFLLSFDTRRFIFEANLEFYESNDTYSATGNYLSRERSYRLFYLNVIYPIRATNSAPFVCIGGGVDHEMDNFRQKAYTGSSTGWVDFSSTDTDNKMFANGGIGYILRRNNTAKMYFYGRGYVMADRMDSGLEYGVMFNVALVVGR